MTTLVIIALFITVGLILAIPGLLCLALWIMMSADDELLGD